jgi:hypothetical protein
MKTLGQIYSATEFGTAKWYEVVWFYIAMIVIFICLFPVGVVRRMREKYGRRNPD